MSTRVNIEAEAWGDLRFTTLARLCGFTDHGHALIKCAQLWAWQTENFTDERPTYVVDVDTVESVLGANGADHLVRAKLGELVPEGVRIKGSLGKIEWLWKLKKRGLRGTAVAALNRKQDNKEVPVGCPAGTPQGAQQGTPVGAPLTLTLTLTEERESPETSPAKPARAHQLPEGWEPAKTEVNAKAETAAIARGISIELELEKLRNWAKADGRTGKDWNARWRLWLQNANPPRFGRSESAARPMPNLSTPLEPLS